MITLWSEPRHVEDSQHDINLLKGFVPTVLIEIYLVTKLLPFHFRPEIV